MTETTQQEVERTTIERDRPDLDVGRNPSVSAEGLRESLENVADSFDVSGFRCAKCDLAHMHDTTKHQIGNSYDVSKATAASMEFNPTCHCGLHEAARRGSDFGIPEGDAASNATSAPIPPETTQELNDSFGPMN